MTRGGFTILVGYTGPKAMRFKELYIKLLHDTPKPYQFSNECDFLNRIVLGMTVKQFRLANGL